MEQLGSRPPLTQLIQPQDLKFDFEDESQYWREGSYEWEREEALQRRRALRRSMRVANAAIRFWQLLGTSSPDDTAGYEAYEALHNRVTAVLAPEMRPWEAERAAEDDWAEDAGEGAEFITLSQFAKGMFSIADMWTDSTDERDYVDFLVRPLAPSPAVYARRVAASPTRHGPCPPRIPLFWS